MATMMKTCRTAPTPGIRERHERDAVVAGVVEHRGELEGARLRTLVAHDAADDGAEDKHAGDDRDAERDDAHGERRR